MRFHRMRGVLGLLALTLFPAGAFAHCDGMDGPVVNAARRALASGDVNPALSWVQKEGEAEVTVAFHKAMAVRKLSAEARDLADRYFFETLVRVHRAGEGEPYTGLKPAGRDLGPAIPAADKSIETGSAEEVVQLVSEAARQGIRERFREVLRTKAHAEAAPRDVEKGRLHVRAYVEFLHYVERLFESAAPPPGRAHDEHAAAAAHGHP